MVPEPGRRFGPYEIQARLGGGGMGHVFRAWDVRLRREVAIKLLHDEFTVPGMRERFLREAQAASALTHPNICTIFDIGEQDGEPYLVMELLQGETLKSRIARIAIPVEELVTIARDVAEGLGAAHAKGIVHRDVKPANIFLVDKPNGKVQAKVLDFGLAKLDGAALGLRGRRLDLTTAGSTVGTLAYMSPEQARGEVLDLRSDLFSLGVVLYEMATRQIPFQGATSALVFVKLLNHAPEPVREWNQQIPRELEKIILKLMEKERAARYQTAAELEQALLDLPGRPSGARWLRKAKPPIPMPKAVDTVARNRRIQTRSEADPFFFDDGGRSADQSTPTPISPTGTDSPLLRPILREPGDKQGTQPTAEPGGAEALTPQPGSGPVPVAPRRVPRERYHPDPDQLFASPGLRPETPSPVQQFSPVTDLSASSIVGLPAAEEVSRGSAKNVSSESFDSAEAPYPSQQGFEEFPEELFSLSELLTPPFRGKSKRLERLWLLAGALMVSLVVLILFVLNRNHLGPTYLNDRDLLVMTAIENDTGNKAFDGSLAEGLRIDLEQSPYLRNATSFAYFTAMYQGADAPEQTAIRARAAAQRLGAKAYLYGRVTNTEAKEERLRGTSPAYALHIDLLRVSNNEILASLDENATSLQQIPSVIDRLAAEIRSLAGENSSAIDQAHNSLALEATGDLEALKTFAQAEADLAKGRTIDALVLYQKALALDPHFVQANLRLAVLYRKQRAEVGASDSARAALASSAKSSERVRTLAQYEYQMNTNADFDRATDIIQGWLKQRPHDSEALSDLARVERLEGRLTDALQHAQNAIAEDPLNLDAYIQGSNALIGLDRYDAALQVEQAAQRQGLARVGGSLIGGYLSGRGDLLRKAIGEYTSNRPAYRSDWAYGLYLDNTGRLSEGLTLWRVNAAAAERIDNLASASAYLLAQAALDRALVGDCRNALLLAEESDVKPQGMVTSFNSGMAQALCGAPDRAQKHIDTLRQTLPKSTDVREYLIPDIKAAIALHANDPATALEELRPVRRYDLISLTPYLRGQAHVALGQMQIGIVDFQTVLSHRGITFTVGTDVYPVAEIGVARAFAVTGDLVNSAAAYRQFLQLWKDADAKEPLLLEARQKSK